jgi:hypothetical protein
MKEGAVFDDSTFDRFWSRVAIGGPGCWEWQGSLVQGRYGQFHPGRRFQRNAALAHRVAFGLMRHKPTKWVLHTCDNPRCVRPSHLFEGTAQDNVDDMIAKGRGLRGAQISNALLVPDDVRFIRAELAAAGKRRIGAALGRRFGVTTTTICDIKHRRTWAWLDS